MLWNPHVSPGVYLIRVVICFMLSIALIYSAVGLPGNRPPIHIDCSESFNCFHVVVSDVVVALVANDAWRWAAICMDHHRSLNIAFIVLSSGRNRSWSWTWSRSGTGNRHVPPPVDGSKPLANVASVAIVQTSSVLSFATPAWLLMAFERTW